MVVVKLPHIMSESRIFENIFFIRILEWLVIIWLVVKLKV